MSTVISALGNANNRSAQSAAPFRWLIGLRWAVLALLTLSILCAQFLLGIGVHYEIAVPAILLGLGSNAAALRLMRRTENQEMASEDGRVASATIAFVVALDLVLIAIVLGSCGGAANPFSASFFIYVALAAFFLPAGSALALSFLAMGLFAGMFALPTGGCCSNHSANEPFSAHLYGMWLAFTLSAGLLAFFLTRVRTALERRQFELERLQRFVALGTLAAGTAHELATPLGTISVLAGEISNSELSPNEARRYAVSIGQQVLRCRDVITKLQASAYRASPVVLAEPVEATVRRAADTWRKAHTEARIELDCDPSAILAVPVEEFEAALCALLDNAHYAQERVGRTDPILLTLKAEGANVTLAVEDSGVGIAPELWNHLGEPFVTTKQPGHGMGMGLYLVRTFVERIGGALEVAERTPHGTRVTLHFGRALA